LFIISTFVYVHVMRMWTYKVHIKQSVRVAVHSTTSRTPGKCNVNVMQMCKAHKKQSLGAAVLGSTPGKYVQSHADGEVGCLKDVVQQQ